MVGHQSKGNRIIGVYSYSNREPLKQKDFPEPYREFEDEKTCSDGKFVYTLQQPGSMPFPAAADSHEIVRDAATGRLRRTRS